jgi:3-dehydro-L-gulonate 2-dehydrogenase
MEAIRISYDHLVGELGRVLERTGMDAERVRRCAELFAGATVDGVASHGVNRFPRFIAQVQDGIVDVRARAERVESHGALERWDGRSGVGNLNAWDSMAAALALSREHGVGCVALANTNHWMRGGTYGWQAADAGSIAMCWTNTLPNLPPWGATEPRVGNNPLVFAVPRPPAHVVLDMAMSQFSFGALDAYRRRGEQLPVDGGYDAAGALTRDPAAIETSGRLLPIGYWKGSGLALMLDLIGMLLSRGRATHQIGKTPEAETRLSQVFIAFDPAMLGDTRTIVDDVIRFTQGTGSAVRYPGERTLATRARNHRDGIPIDRDVWQRVQAL